jgi:hypothetical protein
LGPFAFDADDNFGRSGGRDSEGYNVAKPFAVAHIAAAGPAAFPVDPDAGFGREGVSRAVKVDLDGDGENGRAARFEAGDSLGQGRPKGIGSVKNLVGRIPGQDKGTGLAQLFVGRQLAGQLVNALRHTPRLSAGVVIEVFARLEPG